MRTNAPDIYYLWMFCHRDRKKFCKHHSLDDLTSHFKLKNENVDDGTFYEGWTYLDGTHYMNHWPQSSYKLKRICTQNIRPQCYGCVVSVYDIQIILERTTTIPVHQKLKVPDVGEIKNITNKFVDDYRGCLSTSVEVSSYQMNPLFDNPLDNNITISEISCEFHFLKSFLVLKCCLRIVVFLKQSLSFESRIQTEDCLLFDLSKAYYFDLLI
ncbi:hypothetical protein EGR_09788 [Echinococcus granulosus]|uniref:Uncharacterized protein n=1 Tax=Echinococcus granulosus TaxID=6210 RepID=W6U421_ECHGR|nr:hypothetical protein EGR_09788 [Echinococcus granulosus]EUB55351.1 hypothetical protein EGR_09788 [Echinococcus granulosus]